MKVRVALDDFYPVIMADPAGTVEIEMSEEELEELREATRRFDAIQETLNERRLKAVLAGGKR